MTRTTALIAEDHPLMAQASKALLEQLDGLVVTAIAPTGAECLRLVEQNIPDLVLLDYQLPDMTGVEVTRKLKERHPDIRVIIFTGVDVSDLASRLTELNIHAIISKETQHQAILRMVECVLNDYVVLPRSMMSRVHFPIPTSHAELTEDEIRIMRMLIRGETLEQIADTIHVSKRSVDNYQKRIYEKLGVKNKLQALEAFIQSKYYTDPANEPIE